MSLQAEQWLDLLVMMRNEQPALKITDLTSDYHKFTMYKNLMTKERAKSSGGTQVEFRVKMGTNDNARAVGLFFTDTVNVGDNKTYGTCPWRHVHSTGAYETRVMAMNADSKTKLIDYVNDEKHSAKVDLATKFELYGWGAGPTSTTSDLPYSIPWIIQKWPASGTTSFGWNGGNPSGFTAGRYGISSTTYPRWANGTAKYSTVSKDDLINTWVKAIKYCDFETLVDGTPDSNDRGPRRCVNYTNFDVWNELRLKLEDQNDNLGGDLDKYGSGTITVHRTPVEWIEYLDADASDPIYGVNWAKLGWRFLKGFELAESKPYMVAGQPTTLKFDLDSTFNLIATDLRSLFCLSKLSSTDTAS